MSITKCVLVEAVQRYDAAEGSYMMQSRRPKHRWCPGAELNHRHTDFQSVALPTELPGRLVRGAYRGNSAFLSSRASSRLPLSNWTGWPSRPRGVRANGPPQAMAQASGRFLSLDSVRALF